MITLEQKSPFPKLLDKYDMLRSSEKLNRLTFDERINTANDLIIGLKDDNLYHYRREIDATVRRTFHQNNGRNIGTINLASNDYLNYTKHPEVLDANIQTIEKCGVGAGSVPMLSGTQKIHKRLEEELAIITEKESAITFNSCFAANYGLLSALLTSSDIAVLDTYVHASIIDGCRNTNKTFFQHNDPDSLKRVLSKVSNFNNKLVIIEGVYSMDGDIAKLKEIIQIAKENGAWVMLDESHSLGVLGIQGKGTVSHLNCQLKPDIITASLGKALGGIGGFISGSKSLISLMELTNRPFIFSTAIPPGTAAAIVKSIELLNKNDRAFESLKENIRYFRENIHYCWPDLDRIETAIFPLIIKDEIKLLDMCRALQDVGIFVNPIFYPVVPKRKSRMRISLTAGLNKTELDFVLERITSFKQYLA